ncbi:MAG: hypothetical protein ABI306_04585, partial [Caulobacteraceae bacterium]
MAKDMAATAAETHGLIYVHDHDPGLTRAIGPAGVRYFDAKDTHRTAFHDRRPAAAPGQRGAVGGTGVAAAVGRGRIILPPLMGRVARSGATRRVG